ncbi:hypothetical protein ABIC44_000921 [Sphingomonas sp. 1185]
MIAFIDNHRDVYGVEPICRVLPIAHGTIERPMRDMGLQGVIRGKPVRTTISDKAARCPLDHVKGWFYAPAPNMLRVSDFTPAFAGAGSP